MKIWRTLLWVLVAEMAAGGWLACSKKGATPVDDTQRGGVAGGQSVVRVAYLPILVCSPFFVAQDKRLFQAEGVAVESQPFASSNQVVEALLSGRTDAAMSLAQSVAVTVEAKQPGQFRVFMVNAQTSKDYLSSLVVKKDSPIREVRQLRGKKVGCFPGQTAHVYLEMTLEKYGLGKTDVTIQEIDPASHLQALEAGSIDALLTYEPTTTIGVERGLVRPLIEGAFEKNVIDPWVGGVFVLRRTFVDEHPDEARRFVRALDRAVDFIRAHPLEAKLTLTRFIPIDEQIARKTTNIPYWKLGEIDREQVQKQTDMLTEKGILPTRVDTRAGYYVP